MIEMGQTYSRLAAGQPRPTVTTEGVFFFTRILFPTLPKFWDIQECLFFHQNFVPDHTKILGHTGVSVFFTRILFPTLPKFWDIQEGLSFSPEFCSQRYQNYGTYRRVFLFHQNFVPDVTKIMGHT